jgi:putative endonuclease
MPTRGHQHRQGLLDGFTKMWGLRRLVWFEWHSDIHAAIHREKQIKRWRRQWKFALIEGRNPDWVDLWPALMGAEPYPWESEEEAAALVVGPG